MLKLIDNRKIDNNGIWSYMDIFLTVDKKEVILINKEYYYLSKSGLKVTRKKIQYIKERFIYV